MLLDMASRSPGRAPDVFETFGHRVEDHPARARTRADRARDAGTVARSAGVTIGLMVLTALGFVAGAWVAARAVPEVGWVNPLWEGLAFLVWCGVWGVLGAALVLAGGVLAVGVPWVRRQRGARPTSTSTP
jgi:hypothetical protein